MTHTDADDAASMAVALANAIGWTFEGYGGRHIFVRCDGPTLHIAEYLDTGDEVEYSATVVVETRTSPDEF